MNAFAFDDRGPPGGQHLARPEVQSKVLAGDNGQAPLEHRGAALRSAVFDVALDALLVADDDRRYIDANPAACALLGRSRDEVLALRIEDVSPMGADVAGAWAAFVAQGEVTGAYTLVRPDGSAVPVEFRADFIKIDGSLITDLDRDRHRLALTSALITFGSDIGAVVIAEGIERRRDLETVKAQGISYGQGYLLGRPAVLANLEPGLSARYADLAPA